MDIWYLALVSHQLLELVCEERLRNLDILTCVLVVLKVSRDGAETRLEFLLKEVHFVQEQDDCRLCKPFRV